MNINILTQPLYTNYGGILQNYALQEVIRRRGHTPLTLNVATPPPVLAPDWKDFLRSARNFTRRLSGHYIYTHLSPNARKRHTHATTPALHNFVRKHIKTVNVTVPLTEQTAKDYPADVWIVGSDQVWRPMYSPCLSNWYLDFLPADANVRRIAYAASFGVDNWEYTPEQTAMARELIHRFDEVTVREQSALSLLREHLGIEAGLAPDPTMLLDAAHYRNLIPDELLRHDSPRLTAYLLDPDPQKIDAVNEAARQRGLHVSYTGLLRRDGFDSVEKWLADLYSAQAVVTDSFHGVVFSLIFGKPFRVLTNHTRGNTRLQSLLSLYPPTPTPDGFLVYSTS